MSECDLCLSIRDSGSDLREMAHAIAKLHRMLSPLAREYQRLQRAHPRCAACGILVGPAHAEKALTPEPMRPRARGQRRYDVCSDCYAHLHRTHRSVPQQRAYEKSQADLLGEEVIYGDPGEDEA